MEIIKVDNNTPMLDPDMEAEIITTEQTIARLKKYQEGLKAAILVAMEENNLIKVETDNLAITYIAPTDRETFDSKRFREENPDTYDEYVRMSPVKSSVRIKVK